MKRNDLVVSLQKQDDFAYQDKIRISFYILLLFTASLHKGDVKGLNYLVLSDVFQMT